MRDIVYKLTLSQPANMVYATNATTCTKWNLIQWTANSFTIIATAVYIKKISVLEILHHWRNSEYYIHIYITYIHIHIHVHVHIHTYLYICIYI